MKLDIYEKHSTFLPKIIRFSGTLQKLKMKYSPEDIVIKTLDPRGRQEALHGEVPQVVHLHLPVPHIEPRQHTAVDPYQPPGQCPQVVLVWTLRRLTIVAVTELQGLGVGVEVDAELLHVDRVIV